MEMVFEEVEKHLFEDLADPDSIRRVMTDYSFDEMLKNYYLNGKQDKDATLHLVGRFRGRVQPLAHLHQGGLSRDTHFAA